MLNLVALGALALASPPPPAGCALEASPEAPFLVTLPADAARVRVLVEVWATAETAAWAAGVLAALTGIGSPATLVVPASPDPALIALAGDARDAGHALAVVLPASSIPADPVAGHRTVRAALAPWRPVETVVVAGPSRVQEAVLGRAGVHEILRMEAAGNGAPGLAAVFEGLPRTNVVLSAGPYAGACGTDPRVAPFTPLAADRAAQAIFGASGNPWATVRVGLDGARGRPEDAAVLVRWIETVVRPSGALTSTAPLVRTEARLATRDVDPAAAKSVGRLVAVPVVEAAAAQLAMAGRELPRSLGGPLNLTEAFQAFLLLSQDKVEGDVVRLGPLGPPIARAESSLPGPITLRRDAVLGVGAALLADPPDALPSALPCDGRLLTAAELLLALASLARGEDPVRAHPIEVPEPNAPGLGWGSAGLP